MENPTNLLETPLVPEAANLYDFQLRPPPINAPNFFTDPSLDFMRPAPDVIAPNWSLQNPTTTPGLDQVTDLWNKFSESPPLLTGRELLSNSILGSIPGFQDWMNAGGSGAAATEAVADFGAGFTSPMNLAIAAAVPFAPHAALPWVERAFAVDMLGHAIPQLPETIRQLPDVFNDPQAAYNVTSEGLSLLLGGALAKKGFINPAIDIYKANNPYHQLNDLVSRADLNSGTGVPPVFPGRNQFEPYPLDARAPVGIPERAPVSPLTNLENLITGELSTQPTLTRAERRATLAVPDTYADAYQLPGRSDVPVAIRPLEELIQRFNPDDQTYILTPDISATEATTALRRLTRAPDFPGLPDLRDRLSSVVSPPSSPFPLTQAELDARVIHARDAEIIAAGEPVAAGFTPASEPLPSVRVETSPPLSPSPLPRSERVRAAKEFDDLAMAHYGNEQILYGSVTEQLNPSRRTGVENEFRADARARAADALGLTPDQAVSITGDTAAARDLRANLTEQLQSIVGADPRVRPSSEAVAAGFTPASEAPSEQILRALGKESIGGFEQGLPRVYEVELTFGKPGETLYDQSIDQIQATSTADALQRAKENWPTASVRIKGEVVEADFTMSDPVINAEARPVPPDLLGEAAEPLRSAIRDPQSAIADPALSFNPSSPTFGQSNKLFTKDRLDAALQRVTERSSRASAGVDPGYLRDAVEVGGYYLEAGVRSFAAWSKVMVERLGERIRPHLGDMWNSLSSRDDVRALTGELKPVGKFAGDIVGVQQRVESIREELSAVGKTAFEQAPKIEETGTIQPVETRAAFRSTDLATKPETYTYEFSEQKIDQTRAQLVDARNEIVQLTARLNESADPLSAGAAAIAKGLLEQLQGKFEHAAHEFRRQRFAAGRAVGAYRQFQLPREFVEGLGDVGRLLDIPTPKESLPIWTNIRKNLLRVNELAPAERARLRRNLVDAWRLNLFSVGSWTLDLVGNASELAAQTIAGATGDLVHVARGHVSFPHLQGMFRAIKDRATSFREPLDPRIEQAFGRTVSGEIMGTQSGSAWPTGDRGTFTMRKNALGKTIDTVLGAPLYAKGSFDLAAKRMAGTTAAFREAILAADRHKLTGTERSKFINEFVENLPDNALQAAITEGNKAGFNRQLTNWEEAVGRSLTARLLVDVFARWPFQFARWGGEMLGYNRELWGQIRRGTASPEQVGAYLAKTATGYGGLYLLSQLDNPENRKTGKGGWVDFRSMEYVRDDGSRVRLSGREPLATGLWLVATLRGDLEASTDALRHVSLPFVKTLWTGGLLGSSVEKLRGAVQGGKFFSASLGRELEDQLNRLIPGQAVLSTLKSILDPTLREGVGANLPGISRLTPEKISITTGQPIQPRQSLFGVDVPAVSGTPIPGASLRRDPVYQLLSRYDLLVYRGPRSPLGGTPPADLTRSQRRDWEQLFGQTRYGLLTEHVINKLPELQARYDYDTMRKLIQKVDSIAAKQTRYLLNQKYGLLQQPESSHDFSNN